MYYSLFHFPKKLKKGQSFIKRRRSNDVTGCYIYISVYFVMLFYFFFFQTWENLTLLNERSASLLSSSNDSRAPAVLYRLCTAVRNPRVRVCIHTHVFCVTLPLSPRWQRQSRSISWRRPQCHQHHAFCIAGQMKDLAPLFVFIESCAIECHPNSTKKELIWIWIVRSIE